MLYLDQSSLKLSFWKILLNSCDAFKLKIQLWFKLTAGAQLSQVSLLVSDWRSYHFPAQHPCCVNRECTCAPLGALRCGKVHWWRIDILRQQKKATTKNRSEVKDTVCFLIFKVHYSDSKMCLHRWVHTVHTLWFYDLRGFFQWFKTFSWTL